MEIKIECPDCGTSFMFLKSLKTHLSTVHNYYRGEVEEIIEELKEG